MTPPFISISPLKPGVIQISPCDTTITLSEPYAFTPYAFDTLFLKLTPLHSIQTPAVFIFYCFYTYLIGEANNHLKVV